MPHASALRGFGVATAVVAVACIAAGPLILHFQAEGSVVPEFFFLPVGVVAAFVGALVSARRRAFVVFVVNVIVGAIALWLLIGLALFEG